MIENKVSKCLLQDVKTLSIKNQNVICYVKNRRDFYNIKHFNIVKEYPFINAVGMNVSYDDIDKLSYFSVVEYITKSSSVFTLDDNLIYDTTPKELAYTGSLTGKGVGVCVLDTGLCPHLDFKMPTNRVYEFVDFVNNKEYQYDDNGHGTFVTGVCCGNGLCSGKRVKGLAVNSHIISLKVIGDRGEGGAFNVLDGMQWVLDNHKRLNIKVCCMSFGSTPLDVNDPLKRGADVLVKSGITVVCASGNSGVNKLKSPAISLNVISVGAVDKNNNVADFTSRGYVGGRSKPEIYADGVDVISTTIKSAYGKMSGTSTSCPYVAGACCLLLERFPSANPYQVRDMLLKSSKISKTGQYILRLN